MFSLIGLVFSIITLVLWFMAIMDCGKHLKEDTLYAILWIIVILSFPVAGSIIYFMFRDRTFPNSKGNIDPDFGETV